MTAPQILLHLAVAAACLLQLGDLRGQEVAPRDMRSLIDLLGADEINVRTKAEAEILARWKEWKEEDIDLLQEGKQREAEVAVRTQELVKRITVRQIVGETLLRSIDRIDLLLASGQEEDVLTILRTVGELWKKGGIPGTEVVGLLRWIRARRSTPPVEEALKALEDAGLKEGPEALLPLLNDPSAWRRRSGIQSLVHMMARDKAEELVPLLRDPHPDVRAAASRALARFRARAQAPRIAPLLSELESHHRLAAVALLTRLGAREFSGEIARLLADPLPSVRVAALRALRDLGASDRVDQIIDRLKDIDLDVRREAVRCLGVLRPPGLVGRLGSILEAAEAGIRSAGFAVLGELGSKEDRSLLVKALGDPDYEVRWTAARSLGRIGDREDADRLAPLLSDGAGWVRAAAAEAFGRLGAVEGREKILSMVRDRDPSVRGIALEALGRMGAVEHSKEIRALLAEQLYRHRESALWSLAQFPPDGSEKDILPQLEYGWSSVRAGAIDVLVAWRSKESLEKIRPLLKDSHPRVRIRAAEAVLYFGEAEEVEAVGALLEDPFSWVRSRTALALARKASSLPKGGTRAQVSRMLRRLEWDRKWDVEIAASIGLLRLGEKSAREALDLLDEMATGESELGGHLYVELFDALCTLHARDAAQILSGEVQVVASLETAADVVALFKKLDLRLEAAPGSRLSGRVPAGVSVTGRSLIEERMAPYGVFMEGKTVRLGHLQETLMLWRKKLE